MPSLDPVLLVLGGLVLWWHGAAVVSVMRSRKEPGRKLLWVLAILVLPPFGLVAHALRGRGRGRRRGSKRKGLGVTGYLTIAALGSAALLALGRELWPGYEHAAWIAAWSTMTFVLYAIDKAAAKGGKDEKGSSRRARVDEAALHLFALLGGFVGGWIGRHGLRHKTNKPVFGVVLVVSTVLHGSRLLGLW